MAILEIRKYPDPVLRKKATIVREITDDILRLSNEMIDTMKARGGIGLAANQVGFPIRVIVVDRLKNGKPLVLINPEIVMAEGEEVSEEGCLSIPGYFEFLKRSKKVLAKGLDLDGNELKIDCEGILARAIQHEIDHLDGILFVDRLSPVKRSLFRKAYETKRK
jgi:peptide deformylase